MSTPVPLFNEAHDIIGLRRHAYLARYGDYATNVDLQTAFADKISGQYQWTQISAAIKEESLDWKAHGPRFLERVKTTYAVYASCRWAGIQNHSHMITLVHMYAEGNTAFHRGLQTDLENHKYATIAKFLFDSVCPPNMADQEIAMRAVLEQLRDEWFDDEYVPDEPEA
ncbi:MAG: hypothetical protein Q9219_002886 [cf. Caloplaca sp. 3 TL-2023]